MVVAGGGWQVPLIQYLKNKGHYIINTNLYEDSPGFLYSDESYVLDVRDKHKNLEIARNSNIDAIVSDQSDISVTTVAFIAEKLGLSGIGTDIADLFTDKFKMRKRSKELGYSTPNFELCRSLEDAKRFFSLHDKIVIKPLDSQGGRGVRILEHGTDIETAYNAAKNACKCGNVLIEEFLPGYELTVEGYKTKTGHTTLAISEKRRMTAEPQIAQSIWYSKSALSKHAELVKTHNSLIEDFNLPFGMTHTEYICNNGEYTLIEAAARGGGNKISSHIAPFISGVDTHAHLLDDILGFESAKIDIPTLKCSVVLDFFNFKPGKVKFVDGIESLSNHANVIDVALNFIADRTIPILKDDSSRSGYIIATAENDEALIEILPKLKERVLVTYE